jgi:hypothetical protein
MGKSWTTSEIRRLADLLRGGHTLPDAAEQLGRTVGSVAGRAVILAQDTDPQARTAAGAALKQLRQTRREADMAARPQRRAAVRGETRSQRQAQRASEVQARIEAVTTAHGQAIAERRLAGQSWPQIARGLDLTAQEARLAGLAWAKLWDVPLPSALRTAPKAAGRTRRRTYAGPRPSRRS